MKCSNCGMEYTGDAPFCPKCGVGAAADSDVPCGCKPASGAAASSCSAGSGKKSCPIKKAVGIVAVIFLGIILIGYMAYARPFLSTAPLVEIVPDDTGFYASVDLMNGGRTGLRYVRAIGIDKIKKLMEAPKTNEKGPDMGKAVKMASHWITREIMVIGKGNPDEKDFGVAILLGSHNQGKAENTFPQILEIVTASKTNFEKTVYKVKGSDDKVTIYCQKAPKPGAEPSPIDGMCWSSTNRALVISPMRAYIEHVADSIYGKRTDKQKGFVETVSKEVPDNYVFYAVGSTGLLKSLIPPKKAGDSGPDLSKDLSAVRGAVISLAYDGLSPEYKVSILIDENKAKSAETVNKLVSFKSGVHKIDEAVYPESALAYFSVNNVGNMVNLMFKDIDDKGRGDIEKNLDVSLADLLKAIGGELGVSLIGLDVDKDDLIQIDMIGALEIGGNKENGELLVATARRMINAKNKEVTDPADQMKITDAGKNIYMVEIPDVTRFSAKLKPCIGLTDKYLYFSLNPGTLKKFMVGGKGHSSGINANVKLVVNPSMATGFAGKWFRGNNIDTLKKNTKLDEGVKKISIAKMEKTQKVISGVLNVYGPMTVSVGIMPDKIFAAFKAEINAKSLSELPIDDIKALSDEGKQEASFTKCYAALTDMSNMVEKYKDDYGNGSYAGIDKSGDKLAQLKFFMECSAEGSCKGKVAEYMNKACEAGSFKISKADESEYTIEAKPAGLPCAICMGPFTQNYGTYAACVSNPKKTCADLEYK